MEIAKQVAEACLRIGPASWWQELKNSDRNNLGCVSSQVNPFIFLSF
jgi:hypothetical protein